MMVDVRVVSSTELVFLLHIQNKVSALMHIVSFRPVESHEEGAASAASV